MDYECPTGNALERFDLFEGFSNLVACTNLVASECCIIITPYGRTRVQLAVLYFSPGTPVINKDITVMFP